MKHKLAVSLGVLLLASPALAEVRISGFASIVGGKVIDGTGVDEFDLPPTFLADYPLVGAYEEEISFEPDSLFGLQFSADLLDGLSATAQLVSRGANDFDVDFEWAYISYELNDNWTVQGGKKRLPLYYYSDFFDVGYAYPWVRPPADNYTWQIFNYTGLSALYNYLIGDWTMSGQLYYGSEDDEPNKLLSEFFFGEATREIWKDIGGLVVQLNYDWLDIRLTHMQYTNERYIGGEQQMWDGSTERKGKFYGLSVNVEYENWMLLTEINRLDLSGTDLDTYMVTFGYRFGDFLPYASYSDFDDGEGGEVHNTTSVGVRWDFHPSAAFKVQYDEVKDNGGPGLKVAGDSESFSFGVDLVF
ncbi:porin [Shewanella psychropiezotolerans]|uniref:Porin n=1 Tax=Shewanella psychropiezotolerans TaxID=2593655 RepID=A0ABX5X2V5_9GAMM|nr:MULTISPECIES: porin [Shewanella]MPY23625.1 porin [Shewanella sp. YLB-07]QDO85680.1 porin [Shewanella psychropiezotolerans]